MPLKQRRIMAVLLAIGVWGGLAPGGGRAVRAAGVLSQNCFFESLEVCKILNSQNLIFELCPKIELCDSTTVGTITSTVSSGTVSATVTTTGGSTVSLSTSTTSQDGQVSTCIQIMVDDVSGAFCEDPQAGPLTYQCDITSDSPDVHGTCICQSSALDPTPPASPACAGLDAGCAQFRGVTTPLNNETANGKLCTF